MFSRHWLGSIAVVAVIGSSAAHAAPIATVTDQDFGSVRVANAATLTVTRTFNIENIGDATLTITDVTVFGMQSGDYAITDKPASGTTIAAGATAPVTVVFDPLAAGLRRTTLKVTSDAPDATAALTGTGTSALIAVTDVDFGIVTPGGAGSTQAITISNSVTTNQGPLRVATAALAGGSWFSFNTAGPTGCASATSCTLDVDVPPDRTLDVRCRPPAGSTGAQTATVTFASDTDTGGDAVATLTCDAGTPDINVVTTSIAFGDVPVNPMTPPAMSFTIGNTGTAALVFAASTGASPFSSFYTLSCTTNCTVAAGATAQFTVTFDPTAPTDPNANIDITITSNDPDESPVTIPVTGRCVAPQIDAPASLPSFGDVEVGKLSAAQDLTVTNVGTSTLVISSAALAAGAGDYVVMTGPTDPQMTMIPPMGSVSWGIACRPSTHGSRPGTFRIVSNSFTQSTADVTLACNGQQGVLAVSPTSIDFGAVAQGDVATRTFTLSNTGNVAVMGIAAAVDPATAGYSLDPATPVPATLAAGASVGLTVRFAPQAGANGGPATVTFTGGWGVTPTPTTAVLSLAGTGLTAGFDLSATTIDFGNLRFDTTPERTFCVTNTGQATIQIKNPITIVPGAGTMSNEFLVVRVRRPATCGGASTTDVSLPQTLATNQLLEVTVRAAPANRTGMMQATLTVTSDLKTNPTRSLSLLGNSTSGAFTLAPGPMIDFGAVDVQGAAATQTIKITNTGDGPLDLTSFQRTADAEFTFTLPADTTLLPAQALEIPVTYKPVVASPVGSEEVATISHAIAGAINGPAAQMIVLRGRGIDRVLRVAATPSFPDTFRNPGDQAPVRGVKIQNLGEATLKVFAVMVTNDTDVWQLVDPAPVDLAKSAEYEYLIRFAPKIAGPAPVARLEIMNDDSDRPLVSINLTGNGIDRSVRFEPSTIRLGFTGVGVPVRVEGALVVASTDPTHTFRIRDIALDDGSAFEIEGLTPDLELAPLAERRFTVTFTPDAQGPFTAKARLFLDMDPDAQHEVTVEGTAVFVDAHGGGGCAAGDAHGGGAAGGALLGLAALLGRRRRRRHRSAAAGAATAVAVALALAPAAASADDLALSVFDPTPATTSNGFQLQSPDVGRSGDWALSAVVSHATDPLILDGIAGGAVVNDFAVISRSTVTNLGAAVAFLGRLEAGARLPLYVQEGQQPGNPLEEFTSQPAEGNARGDLALHAKVRLVRKRLEGDGAFIAGLGGQLTLPTATPGQFAGAADPSGRVLLLGSLMPGAFERRVTLTMNAGGVIRARSTYANLEQKSGVAWGLGLGVRALDSLWLAGEVYGDTVPAGRTDEMTRTQLLSPIEWLAGLRWKPDHRVTIGLAGGRGLTSAVGTPAARGVLSLTITPGAPELRPIRPPRPDGDRDGDGVRDSVDRCADEPEDADMFDDTDGCPDPDNDGDGVPDGKDRCPIEAEDADGFQDDDGCLDKDNDNDGIPDARDKCPLQAEDPDRFNDTDGCPDPDNDQDGIPDVADRCPANPETINGRDDNDGCPDKGDSLVVLSPDRIEMLDAIQFTANQKVARASHNLLAQVGATMRARTEIARLRVTVHVQPTDDSDRDQELSDKRAAAIREWLVQWGVAPGRLEARGFGGDKPVVAPESKGAAALNQRVELIILERK